MIAVAVCVLLSQAPEPPSEPVVETGKADIDKAFAEEAPRPVKVTLRDGKVVVGRLLLRDDLQMLVETEDGQPVTIDVADVKTYEEPLQNRNRSRYLFASTAFTPEPGQVTVTQAQLLATF